MARNRDYVIYITTKRGAKTRYDKEGEAWTQTASTGIVRKMTAEQLLSHLLPPLAGDQRGLTVTVINHQSRSHRTRSPSAHRSQARTD